MKKNFIDTYKTLFEKSIEKTSEQKNSILTHNKSFLEKLTLNSLAQHIVICFYGHKLFINSRKSQIIILIFAEHKSRKI